MINERSVYQTEKWARFQESLGFETRFLGSGETRILVIIKRLPLGKCFFELPRVRLTEKIWEQVAQLAKKEKAIFARIAFDQGEIAEFITKYKLDPVHRFPELTLMLDLAKSEEELLAAMSQQGRRHLRKAQKSELEVVESRDAGDFYGIIKETTSRQGFSGHNQSYYQKLLDHLEEKAKLLVVKKGQQILAGAIYTYAQNTCTYLYGASSSQERKLQAPTLMQWQAILDAKKRGFERFDFFGIAPKDAKNHPWFGVSQFKRKFGGLEVAYAPTIEVPFSQSWYLFFNWAQKLRGKR
jgi:lipid II:glycine glycyltransferase (peptidoglycan interpeptide bridge formation enzyme)